MRERKTKRFVPTNLLALHRAVQKPAPTPHGTSARFAAIHQLVSSFRVRASDPAGARITSISGTPATRRRRVGGNGGPPFKGFAFTASPSSGGPWPRPQKGPAALPDLMAAANAADPEEQVGKITLLLLESAKPAQTRQSVPMGVLEGLGGVGHALGTN